MIFFNVAESDSEDTGKMKKDDLEEVRRILEKVEVNVPLANPTRLGTKSSKVKAGMFRSGNRQQDDDDGYREDRNF